jgi:hypothetical protein
LVTSYRYSVADNLFTHFILPAAMPGGDSSLQVELGGNIVPYAPGTLFDLTQYVPGGVSEFFLSGIDVEERLSVEEISPFVSGLQFAANGAADILITPADVYVLADYNSDNVADAADYVVLRKLEAAEAHFNLWSHDFGEVFPGSSSSSTGTIPEPTSGLLSVFGACLTIAMRIRKTAVAGGQKRTITLERPPRAPSRGYHASW